MSRIQTQTTHSDTAQRATLIHNLLQLGETSSTETALFHQAAAATFGLGITDMKALSALLHENAMPAGKLSQQLHLTTGAVTNVIDRLERKGYARRQADANDRRKVMISVNKQELHRQQYPYGSMGKAFSQQLEKYSINELKFLVRYHQDVIELTKKEISKITKE